MPCLVCHSRKRLPAKCLCEWCTRLIPARFRRPLDTYYPLRRACPVEFAEALAGARQWQLFNVQEIVPGDT